MDGKTWTFVCIPVGFYFMSKGLVSQNQEAAYKFLKASPFEIAASNSEVCKEQWMVPPLEVRQIMENDELIRAKRALESTSNESLVSAAVTKKKKHRVFRHSLAGRMRNQAMKKSKAAKYRSAGVKNTALQLALSAPTKSEKMKTKYNKWKKMRQRRH